jgi:phage replication-related protein YjqB (UPF0714/DUF867 family)
MRDTYRNFEELRLSESDDAFSIASDNRSSRTVIVAPHAGGIEPGTSEIARALADADLSYYLFEGKKRKGNKTLHLTSSNFDEPGGLALMRRADRVVAVHGERGKAEVAYLGGLDRALRLTLQQALRIGGYDAREHPDPMLQGLDKRNICNAGRLGEGLQLELSDGLRKSFFESLSRIGRTRTKARLYEFSAIVRKVVLEAAS